MWSQRKLYSLWSSSAAHVYPSMNRPPTTLFLPWSAIYWKTPGIDPQDAHFRPSPSLIPLRSVFPPIFLLPTCQWWQTARWWSLLWCFLPHRHYYLSLDGISTTFLGAGARVCKQSPMRFHCWVQKLKASGANGSIFAAVNWNILENCRLDRCCFIDFCHKKVPKVPLGHRLCWLV